MSDSPDKQQGAQSEDLRLSLLEIEKRFLKLASIQTILSVAAVFTGAIALYAALSESSSVRKQTAASVWPYVQTVITDTDNADEAFINITLNNVGVGPAKMQGVLIEYKGDYVKDWESFAKQFDSAAQLGVTYGKSDVRNRVLAPQETLLLFQTDSIKLARAVQAAISAGELSLSYCYCSIFDDCWLNPLSNDSGVQTAQPVEQCPSFSGVQML